MTNKQRDEIEGAHAAVNAMCKRGQWTMSVPPMQHDSDFQIVRALDAYEELCGDYEHLIQLVCELIQADYLRGVAVPDDILVWATDTVEKEGNRGTITEMTYRTIEAQNKLKNAR